MTEQNVLKKSALWRCADIPSLVSGHPVGDLSGVIEGVSIDTRTVRPGDLFVALSGGRHDGHDFIPEAFHKGARLALVSQHTPEFAACGPLVVVPDSLKAVRALAQEKRKRVCGTIIGVTGSMGKTSTKEMFRRVLSTLGQTHASQASYNNHLGVPLSLATMPDDVRFGIFEMGMNHAGEILDLAGLVRPDIAVITGISEGHLGSFRDVSEIAQAKAEIFFRMNKEGMCFLPRDTPHFDLLRSLAQEAGVAHVFSFGRHALSDVRLCSYTPHGDGGEVVASVFGCMRRYALSLPGGHSALNSLSVLGACAVLGQPFESFSEILSSLPTLEGRGKRHAVKVEDRAFQLIDESYNANPASMRAALAVLSEMPCSKAQRKIAVLGDMLELGDYAVPLHRALVEDLSFLDGIYLAGPLMRTLWEVLPLEKRLGYAETGEALIPALKKDIKAGDVVMIKGSFASGMGKIVTFFCQNNTF